MTMGCLLYVAFGIALVHVKTPGQFLFHQTGMRRCLWRCLWRCLHGEWEDDSVQFPVKKERRRGKKIKAHNEIPVFFYSCCLPEISGLIECTNIIARLGTM